MKRPFILFCISIFLLCSSIAESKVQVKSIPYTHGEISFEGVIAWDEAVKEKRPGILVFHEWWGLNDYAQSRVEQLASLGYVALAVDMYGEKQVTTHPKKASQWMQQITANVENWQERARKGLELLQANPRVDPTRLAAIGYCFGGATVMQLVYSGAPVKGVVSFHGSLPLPLPSQKITSQAKILIAHGEADPFLTPEHITDFKKSLDGAKLDWQMVVYGRAQHSFTNPSANQYGVKGLQYQESADRRSWNHMKGFFEEIFP